GVGAVLQTHLTILPGQEMSAQEGSLLLRILLVGRTGSGKSATGNSILCRPAFESRLAAQSVTKACQGERGTWNGRDILVVDTPSIFEAKAHSQEMYKDIADCYLLSAPGPHVLLLVTQLGRFTAQDAVAVRRVKEVFGTQAMRHTIVLFTHREDLGDESLDHYVVNTRRGRRRPRSLCALPGRGEGAGGQAEAGAAEGGEEPPGHGDPQSRKVHFF
uniref:AIG1-type G domain-containing protein n=1 Tax=Spermophilus dauricus TaxID=99837 RepID=A0A8C9UU28_SPEDA